MRRGAIAYVHRGAHKGAYGVVVAASFSEVLFQSAGGELSVRPADCTALPRGLPAGAEETYHVGAPDRTSIPILDENRLEAARVVTDGLVNRDLAHQMAAAPLLVRLLSDLAEEAPDACPTKRLAEAVVDYLTRPRLVCPTCTGAGQVARDAIQPCETCSGCGTIAGPSALLAVLPPSAAPTAAPLAQGERRARIPPLTRFEQIGLKRLLVDGPKRGPTMSATERGALVGLSLRRVLVTHTDVQSPEGFLFELTPEGERVARELLRRGDKLSASQVRLLQRLDEAGEEGMVVPAALGGAARVLREEVVPPLVEYVPGPPPRPADPGGEAPAESREAATSPKLVRRWWRRQGRAHLVRTEGAVMTLCRRNAATPAWSDAPADAELCDTCIAESGQASTAPATVRQRLTAAGHARVAKGQDLRTGTP